MGKYQLGQCLPLNDDGDLILCEILGYKGSGYYSVSLTRGTVNMFPRKYPPVSSVHESVLEELLAEID